VIVAVQLTPAATMAATLLSASVMVGAGMSLKRLDFRPRTHPPLRLRLPRRRRP
jgi:hypothetical protein